MGEFEEVLNQVGSDGRFQKLLIYLVLFPSSVLLALSTLNLLFLLAVPPHTCQLDHHLYLSEEHLSTRTLPEWKNLLLPMEMGPDSQPRFSQCQMYDLNGTRWEYDGETLLHNESFSLRSCRNGWDFDRSELGVTIASENEWVCEKETFSTNIFTAAAVGSAIGTIIFGQLADVYGRRPIFLLVSTLMVVFKLMSFFVTHMYELFLFFNIVSAMAFPINYNLVGMLTVELADKRLRTRAFSGAWMVWVVGMCLLAFMAWYLTHWRILGLVSTLPCLLMIAYWWVLPESASWLLSAGRVDDAMKVLQQVARINKRPIPSTENLRARLQLLANADKASAGGAQRRGALSLFSNRRLGLHTIILTVCWTMNVSLYNCIHLNLTWMGGSAHLNLFLLGLAEVPSAAAALLLCDRLGRRWTHVGFMILATGSFAVLTGVATFPIHEWVRIGLYLITKFSITASFLTLYMQGSELYPTCLRATGISFSSTVSAVLGIFCPYIIFLGTVHAVFPPAVQGIMCLVGTIGAAFLPETMGAALPETIHDAEQFELKKFWSWSRPLTESGTNKVRLSKDKDILDETEPFTA